MIRVPGLSPRTGWPAFRPLLIALALLALTAFGPGSVQRGNRLYRAGRYAEAVQAYQQALADGNDSPELHYNLGTALLRLGRYSEAEQHLRPALTAVQPELRQPALYNLGNRFLSEARSGGGERQAQVQRLDAAAEAYKQALRLRPKDADAKWNLELALREKEKQQSGGGGGGQQDEQEQQQRDQGGGAGSSQTQPTPGQGDQPRGGQGPAPMSQGQADRILSAVEQDERELLREKVKKGHRETRVARDW